MTKNLRTDLAIELHEQHQLGSNIPGVKIAKERDKDIDVGITWVSVTNSEGAIALGKPIGNYITLESNILKQNDPAAHKEIAKVLAQKLGKLHNLAPNAQVLIIGLGNRYVTPDALGPQVCERVLITRHMGEHVPEGLQGKLCGVSALAPGVMGITGIETAEIVKGVCDRIHPDIVIAIDALAARSASRINTTIQICDTGISPGAGMGNKRAVLNEESLGVPVIAIGVPTAYIMQNRKSQLSM